MLSVLREISFSAYMLLKDIQDANGNTAATNAVVRKHHC